VAHPLKHAQSSARKFGGKAEDYLAIHQWFDESKAFLADFRHRALRHHAEGIFLCEKLFGVAIKNSEGALVPVRYLAEQHVKEDLGRIPTAQDWLLQIQPQRWMYGRRSEHVENLSRGNPGGTAGAAKQNGARDKRNRDPETIVTIAQLLKSLGLDCVLAETNPVQHRDNEVSTCDANACETNYED
jgi:hypothetical protein